MSRELIDKIARAVLYEGYILYPYRPSVKSQQRWTFGGLYPQTWTDAQRAGDPSLMQTECLFAGPGSGSVRINVRFLHLINRTVGKLLNSTDDFKLVDSLCVGDVKYYPWQEAADRDVDAGTYQIDHLLSGPREMRFGFPAMRMLEPLRETDGTAVGMLIREQQAVEARAGISAAQLEDGLFKINVTIGNLTPMDVAATPDRDNALMRTLISTHAILAVRGGEFVSLTDPPAQWKRFAASCQNIGNWPVLVGTEPDRGTILASPIILYDYPQIAPESPGDLFDATEIDEILSLRILTLTDDEKRAAAGVDGKTREMMARTESLAREQLMGLHGTMRGMQPVAQEQSHG